MNRISKLSVLGILLLLFSIATATGLYAEVGVTDDSILVGCSNSFSGPLVYPGTQLVNNGLEAYFGYVNDRSRRRGKYVREPVRFSGF